MKSWHRVVCSSSRVSLVSPASSVREGHFNRLAGTGCYISRAWELGILDEQTDKGRPYPKEEMKHQREGMHARMDSRDALGKSR